MAELTMDKLVALCKNRGFIFAGSEIYGGLANTWDYGPLGVEFKNNVKKAWWQKFVQASKYNTGLDCAILMNREVWVASGHVGGFNDPLMDCKACKARFRADKLIEDFTQTSSSRTLPRARRPATAGPTRNWKSSSRSMTSSAPSAAKRTSPASGSSTSCSRPSRA